MYKNYQNYGYVDPAAGIFYRTNGGDATRDIWSVLKGPHRLFWGTAEELRKDT